MNANNDTLVSLFLKTVEFYPNHPALYLDGKSYSYRQIYEISAKLAAVFCNHSSKQVVIFCNKNLTAYTAIIATLLAGKAYVPLNPKLPITRSSLMLERAEASILIADTNNLNQLQVLLKSQRKILVILPELSLIPSWGRDQFHKILGKTEIESFEAESILKLNINKQANAYLMFTSGTTGIPKGVMVKHSNIVSYVNAVMQRNQPNATDRFSQITELTFDLSVHDMFVCWAVGACLYPITDKEFFNLAHFINKHQLTFWLSVPSVITCLQQLRKNYVEIMPSLRCSIFCGEVLTEQLAAYWRKIAPCSLIDNFYGPTEATVACTAYRWQSKKTIADQINIPIGRAFQNQSIAIINKQLQPVPNGETGELCIAGSQVVAGYWQDLELTKQRFISIPQIEIETNHWYRTGDLVLWDDDAGLIFKGRIDDQMQIKGCRVERLEIELALQSAVGSTAVAIIPYCCDTSNLILGVIAFVCNTDVSICEILKRCRNTLPDYLLPLEIIQLESLPANINGKVDYKALNALYLYQRRNK